MKSASYVKLFINSSKLSYIFLKNKNTKMFLSAIRQFSQKSNILVVGGGQIGKSVALGLNRHGYENITVADPNNANQAVLEEAGIKESV